MKRDPLYLQFTDILHEMPEAEDALRAWRKQQALTLIRRRNEERRQRVLDDALAGLRQQLRVASAGKPDSVG
ncbi:hypothetical protein [Mesorhizobium sp. 2RAF21]|uniref:hypothetical protein n=1 Tax=Mesorhizobium sp. 2RAF21 TaxID=3232995 RepID=UPI003F9CD936